MGHHTLLASSRHQPLPYFHASESVAQRPLHHPCWMCPGLHQHVDVVMPVRSEVTYEQ